MPNLSNSCPLCYDTRATEVPAVFPVAIFQHSSEL